MKAKLDSRIFTNLRLAPRGSQIFVVTALVGGLVLIGVGSLMSDRLVSLAGLVIVVAAFGAFFLTHRNADSAQSPQSEIEMVKGGDVVRIKLAPMITDTPTGKQLINTVLQSLTFREPLPMPDGFVSSDMQPDPNKKLQAGKAVESVNALAEERDKVLLRAFSGSVASATAQMTYAEVDERIVADIPAAADLNQRPMEKIQKATAAAGKPGATGQP